MTAPVGRGGGLRSPPRHAPFPGPCFHRRPPPRQSPRPGWTYRMKLLSHLSPDGDELPKPADARRLALGFEGWNEALALAQGTPASDPAGQWSAAGAGKRLLASIFGNGPFLSGVAGKE